MSLLKKLFKKKDNSIPLSVQFQIARKASDPFLYENAQKVFQGHGIEYRDNEVDEDELLRDQISPREVKKGGEYNVHVEMDVMEDQDAFLIILVTPGVHTEQLNIEVIKNIITISGDMLEVLHKDEKVHKSERLYGRFGRSLHLPDKVDKKHITAVIRHGILTVRIPKVK